MSRFDEQLARIQQIFGADEVPKVTETSVCFYGEYLKINLACPCLLTGIESLGYFKWEERFAFGYGTKAEYARLRSQNGSYKDTYELLTFNARFDEDWDELVVTVQRIPHRKQFTIPLSELQAVDKASRNYQLLHDYSVWFVNWQ